MSKKNLAIIGISLLILFLALISTQKRETEETNTDLIKPTNEPTSISNTPLNTDEDIEEVEENNGFTEDINFDPPEQ